MLQQVNKLVKKNTIYYLYGSTASLNFSISHAFILKLCKNLLADEIHDFKTTR